MTTALWRIATPVGAGAIHPICRAVTHPRSRSGPRRGVLRLCLPPPGWFAAAPKMTTPAKRPQITTGLALAILKLYGSEKVIKAANKLVENGLEPLPSKVEKELGSMVREEKLRGSNAQIFNTAADIPTPKKPLKPRGRLIDVLNASSTN